jgi:hypothetical protein
MHPAMSDLNNSVVYQAPAVDYSGFQASTPSQVSGSVSSGILYQLLSLITIWRVILLLLVLGNVKNIPLIWHVSIIQAAFFASKSLTTSISYESSMPSGSVSGLNGQRSLPLRTSCSNP